MRPSDWLNNLFKRHSLSVADSRPLYEYRVTDEEFESLKNIMRLYAKAGLSNTSTALLWDVAFVMYSAEWWRREYDGSSWAWDTIFNSFDANAQDLNDQQRYAAIRSGFRYWGRKIRENNDRAVYLGSIACEGGLPLKQLVRSKSSLGSVFNKAIPMYVRLNGSIASEIVAEFKDYLPKAYQNSDIYEILGDMIQSVVSLKKEYALNQKTNPVFWLNTNVPTWRERFPLPMNDEISLTLLSDMVKIAATNEVLTVPFQAARYLNDDYSVTLKIEFLPFIDIEAIRFKAEDTVPARLEIELLDSDGNSTNLGFALKTTYRNKASLKMPPSVFLIKGEKSSRKGYRVQFKHLAEIIDIDEQQSFIAEELSDDVPWIFVSKNEEWILEGVASVSTRAKRVRVLYPKELNYAAENAITKISELAAFSNRKLIEMMGEVRLTDCQDSSFKIKTNQEIQTSATYYLNGKLLNFDCSPSVVYLGFPELIGINKETEKRTISSPGQLVAKAVGSKSEWLPLNQAQNGVHEIRLKRENVILFRKRCVLLSPNFSVRLKSLDVLRGIIYLDNVGHAKIYCDSKIYHIITTDNGNTEIQLTAENTPPAFVSLTLSWTGMAEILTLKIPFPASGGQLIDAKNNILSREDSLFQDALHGVRLRLFNELPNAKRELQLEFNLKTSGSDEKDLRFCEKLTRNGSIIELSIIDYLEKITSLLSLGKLDSFVKLSIYEKGSELLSIKIGRYQFSLERNNVNGSVFLIDSVNVKLSYDEISKINLFAMRLSQPEQEHLPLESGFSEQTEIGSWFFDPEKRVREPWLIYSSKESTVQLRPILWLGCSDKPITAQSPLEITTLHSAIIISDPTLRALVIRKILLEMSVDFEHSGWKYLSHLWQKCSHLPLSSFDVWMTVITLPEVLATFCLKMDKDLIAEFTDKLSVLWELVTLDNWVESLSYYRSYLHKNFDEVDVNELLERRIDRIGKISESMMSISHWLRHFFLKKLEFVPVDYCIKKIKEEKIELDRRQANSQWLLFLSSELKKQWKYLADNEQKLLNLYELPEHHYSTVVLPALLAIFCLKGMPNDWTIDDVPRIFKLKQIKEFDVIWFNEVFKFSLAALISQFPDRIEFLKKKIWLIQHNDYPADKLNSKLEKLNDEIEKKLLPEPEAIKTSKTLSLKPKKQHQV